MTHPPTPGIIWAWDAAILIEILLVMGLIFAWIKLSDLHRQLHAQQDVWLTQLRALYRQARHANAQLASVRSLPLPGVLQFFNGWQMKLLVKGLERISKI